MTNQKLSLFIVFLLLVSTFSLLSVPARSQETPWSITIKENGTVDPPNAPISAIINVSYTLTSDILITGTGINCQLNKTIVIDGANHLITGTSMLDTGVNVWLYSQGITVRNFRIEHCGGAIGMASNLSKIENNILTGNNIGISYSINNDDNQDGCYISNNQISSKYLPDQGIMIGSYGIVLRGQTACHVTGNTITGLRVDAIQLGTIVDYLGTYYPKQNVFRSNTLQGNEFALNIEDYGPECYNNDFDLSNKVDGKPICYLNSVSGQTVPSNAGHVVLAGCSDVTVDGVIPSNGGGITLANTIGSTVKNCKVENGSTYSVQVIWGSGNTVKDNTVKMPGKVSIGLAIRNSSDNIVSGNNITMTNGVHSDQTGIKLQNSINTKLQNNTIVGPGTKYSEYISTGGGLVLANCIGTNATDNIFQNKARILFSIANASKFYHNNFVNWSAQATFDDLVKFAGSNTITWDNGYPSGGNYWGISGTDVKSGPSQDQPGSDGIIDAQLDFIKSAGITDRYPLAQATRALPVIPELGYFTLGIVLVITAFAVLANRKRKP